MTISRRSTLAEVASAVADALRKAGIHAVLTGGACATLYSEGAYQSQDLDFIITAGGTRRSLDRAMETVGFQRDGDHYRHPETPFFVEFPRGPLAIGQDIDIAPIEFPIGSGHATALSPTDACRDRLAAFYHWSDRQSEEVAVEIALRHRVNMAAIRRWSAAEGHVERFDEFRKHVARRRRKPARRPALR